MEYDAVSETGRVDAGDGTGRSTSGRRGFLGALAGAGLGASAGLSGCLSFDGSRAADRDRASIVYAFARADPDDPGTLTPRQKTVPAGWLDELNRAFDVHSDLASIGLDGIVGSFVVPGDHADPRASVSVHVTAEDLREEVAGIADDVEFSVDVLDELQGRDRDDALTGRPNTVANVRESDVPGGVLCGSEAARGTLGPAIYDEPTGTQYFTTANHLYGGSGTANRGESLYLYTDGEREAIGRVVRGFREEDVVVAEPVDGYAPLPEIVGADPRTVAGHFTRVGLADLQARGARLEKVGAISGHTDGEIKGVDGITFYVGDVIRTGQLIWGNESTFTDGDSGSVNFHPDPRADGQVLIGGVNNARTWWPGFEFTWGTAAYEIRRSRELTF